MAAAAELHFLLVPVVAQGHIIPMVDLACLLVARGARVTVVTTPVNAARNRAVVEGARRAGLLVELAEVAFPGPQLGLPEGLQNVDQLVEKTMFLAFFQAIWNMAAPLEEYVRALPRRRLLQPVDGSRLRPPRHPAPRHALPVRLLPACRAQPYQARRVRPRRRRRRGAGLPGARRRQQGHVPGILPVARHGAPAARRARGRGHRRRPAHQHVPRHRGRLCGRLRGCARPEDVGHRGDVRQPAPIAMDADATADRGNRADVDADRIVSWLDAQPAASVLYVSFGSIAHLPAKQVIEPARGLEASGRPFVWAIKEAKTDAGVRVWLDGEGFEERVKDTGLLVLGWAPQVTILAHPAVGGFLTHCGWNATLEAISHGVPVLTWPNFDDQFSSEKLLVDVLGVGVRSGVRSGVRVPVMNVPEEAEGVQVTSSDVEKAVAELMEEGAGQGARREGEGGDGGRPIIARRPDGHDPLRLGAREEEALRAGDAFCGGTWRKEQRQDQGRCYLVRTVLNCIFIKRI